MDPNSPTPGDNGASPTPPAANPAPNPQPTPPTGSDSDNNPGNTPPAMVPSDRLREETEKRRQAEEELQRYRDADNQRNSPTPSPSGDEELDPDVIDLVKRSAKHLGFITQEELTAREMAQQVNRDVQTLTAEYATSSVPYNHQEIVEYARQNNLPLTSKPALKAAYRSMNFEKLLEVERQRAIEGAHNPPAGNAERPGGGTPTPPTESPVEGRNPKERGISRIRLARQKLHQ